jgi:peptidoglycan hydrolase-like protein with peptidoglycan-binding domain
MAFAARKGMLHLFDYNYYTVEFWLFYNLLFASFLLWQMYKTIEDACVNKIAKNAIGYFSLSRWRIKTASTYSTFVIGIFFTIIYFPSIPVEDPSFAQYSTKTEESSSIAQAVTADTLPLSKNKVPLQFSFTNDFILYDEGLDIFFLQQFLNNNNFILVSEGPGSPGEETLFFGPYTYGALIQFQKEYTISETGYLGPLTREVINSIRNTDEERAISFDTL